VRYVGEPIAVVIADSAALAEDALEAIVVDIEPLPPVADRAAARADASRLFDDASNLVTTLAALRGDVDSAFRDAPYVRRSDATARHRVLRRQSQSGGRTRHNQ
jgi:carbon-monoxide dehydrogenase large subunit